MRQSGYSISVGQKDIRAIAGDHYININKKVAKEDVASKLVDDILPAGTLVDKDGKPSNGTNTWGLTFTDVDFKNSKGTEILPVTIHGFINSKAIEDKPTAEAIAALKQITFM
ncbi:hypothetical protein FDC50_07030 [Clostridium botulinum]|uniref:Uncharacterized protein n=1 Tax=Clostridium botulinum (strain Eklund 17B / Type B) TaxID=935198 RepID=B2TNW7_CLOBB|nr:MULTISPECIES: hypothetical protein [unclassified Clostridium]ACD25057.1 conserved hypothetical protein [Clostridium botulinum B str. Eklund 17B (NRP)]AIY80774.1 hypothetical protein U728_829 [Clostridium botulinum 202F]KAI3344258.1 hypothetical protein CIT17_17735 [Clostridium botulinum]KFX56089.1 hypothetical protein KU41_17050 [Clostridium botulinum]KFX56679.1 hypothetical protein KU40_08190 [Clostridium botulinum]